MWGQPFLKLRNAYKPKELGVGVNTMLRAETIQHMVKNKIMTG